jgi:hypothetical protein
LLEEEEEMGTGVSKGFLNTILDSVWGLEIASIGFLVAFFSGLKYI